MDLFRSSLFPGVVVARRMGVAWVDGLGLWFRLVLGLLLALFRFLEDIERLAASRIVFHAVHHHLFERLTHVLRWFLLDDCTVFTATCAREYILFGLGRFWFGGCR